MAVLIKHIVLTSLNANAFTKTISKYVKFLNLNCDIVVSFDRRLKRISGNHFFDKKHIIRMSVAPERRKDYGSLVFDYVSTILHELKHAHQYELNKKQYNDKKFYLVEQVVDKTLSEWYSQCETEARIFENKYLHAAVAFYNSVSY